MGSVDDTEKVKSTAGWDGKGCVRRKGGWYCRNTEEFFFFPVCLKSGGICSEAAPEGRLEVRRRYLDHWREALGVIWGRKLGIMLDRSG